MHVSGPQPTAQGFAVFACWSAAAMDGRDAGEPAGE